jgi:excinuclease ABC subunit C
MIEKMQESVSPEPVSESLERGSRHREPVLEVSIGDGEEDQSSKEAHPLASKIAAMPHLPGVYLFKDAEGIMLYVGKAKDLRKRTSSYMRGSVSGDIKTRVFLAKATDIEYIVTSGEKEALLLEASLIKKHRPRYNVILRDDKNYPALRIDPREPFPRLDVVRRFQKDKALYFGPYPSAYAVRETLKILNQLFPLRHCKGKKLMPRERPCLNYALGRCLGACAGKVTEEDYHKAVDEVVLFLQGKTDALRQQLQRRMTDAASVLDFEQAAWFRDRLQGVAAVLEKQRIVSDRFRDQDVLGLHQEEGRTILFALFVRQGVLNGKRDFDLKEAQGEKDEILRSFIQQYYSEGRFIPDEIIVPVPLEDSKTLEEWLTEAKSRRVRIFPPRRGTRRYLLDLAESNARERFSTVRKHQQRDASIIQGLQRILKLPAPPERMACVDISNIQGMHAVGAIVVFADGQPDKNSYRHFRIEGKNEPDDPAMMAEVVERFFKDASGIASNLDLLVLDGGKGHLNRIIHLLKEMDLTTHPPVISLAKEREADRGSKGRGLYEKVYLPGRKNPVFLSHFPDVLHLLQRLRDEAHRFAISHYQNVHSRELLSSALDSIPGIGQRRKQILLQHFESMDALRQAGLEELRKIPGISEKVAEAIAGVDSGQ